MQNIVNLNQWCVTKLDNSQFHKNPLIPSSRITRASTTDNTTWSNYLDCKKMVDNGSYDALGFVLTESDPFFVFDIDKINPDDDVFPLHFALADDFKMTYTEISSSGSGLHIIGSCEGLELTSGRKSPNKRIEFYFKERFIILTGESNCEPILSYQKQKIESWLEALWPKKAAPEKPKTVFVSMSDNELLERMFKAKNGESVRHLFYSSSASFASESEADMSLLSHLCYWSQDDSQVIRLFKTSVRGERAKINREDYLPRTIRAIRGG